LIKILFISNSPTANLLQIHLMEILKVRIDIVEDLDRGLKDVFEQRPFIVCIQNQIAGITSESVVSHVNMLLSDNAPKFILLHDGNNKTTPSSDMLSDQVDISRPFEEVFDSILKSLRLLLAEHWDMVYQPASETQDLPPEPKSELNPADQLVEDFIAEHSLPTVGNTTSSSSKTSEAANPLFEHDIPGGPPAEFHQASSALFVPESIEKSENISAPEREPVEKVKPVSPPADIKQLKSTEPKPNPKTRPEINSKTDTTQKPVLKPVTAPVAKNESPGRTIPTASLKTKNSVPPVSNKKPINEPSVPVEEILRASADNYRRYKRNVMLGSLVSVFLIIAFFAYYWNGKTVNLAGLSKIFTVKQQPTASPSKSEIQPPPDNTKQAAPKTDELPVKPLPVPSFIPAAGLDPDFEKSRPGWHRYLAGQREYRLFLNKGDLNALQVIASAGKDISVAELKQNLLELTGSEQYSIVKKEQKEGIYIEHCIIEKHGELMIYRTAVNGPINAFVFARTP